MKAQLRDAIRRGFGRKNDDKSVRTQVWSIGIYIGESPLALAPLVETENPVITGGAVSDVPAAFVADPFMIKNIDTWYMFFEVMNCNSGKGEIGLAVSPDGLQWSYQQIVLREPFHLSYPYVFSWNSQYYMIPESCSRKSVRLYKAINFPTDWSFERELIKGDNFQDSSVFYFDSRWWMLTDVASSPYYAGMLRLFFSEDLAGPWTEHPRSPLISADPRVARPAGRVLVHGDQVIRFAQECAPVYGSQVRAFEILDLTSTNYHEREAANHPIMTGSGAGWNQAGMHHIDAHPTADGAWIGCVDGFRWEESSSSHVEDSKSGSLNRLKRRCYRYKPYVIASEIKDVVMKHLMPVNSECEVISLKPAQTSKGNVLFAYVTHAFSGQAVPYSHTSYWESRQMAETLVGLGYSVDVINAADAGEFVPQKKYVLFVGHRHNFDRLAARLDSDCIKVLHCDVAHWLFHNTANSSRLLAFQRRKGITLPQRRLLMQNSAIERADCATVLGNEFTMDTYRYANKPIYRVPISVPMSYPWPKNKNFEASSKHFLWFGSNGFIHKGLDLALDAFATMPDCHLTVCGPIKDESERDFERVYYRELYQTPNIHTVGWIDDTSSEFLKIANRCIAVINPSCSEGGGGSVITCMHAGLIPIVSFESSVDIGGFGILLPDCTVDSIRKVVRLVAGLASEELAQRARQAWEFARCNHTRSKFADEYKATMEAIIAMYGYKTVASSNSALQTSGGTPMESPAVDTHQAQLASSQVSVN